MIAASRLCRLLLIVLAGSTSATAQDQNPLASTAPHWREGLSCGVSSVYVFVGLLGYRHDPGFRYSDIRASIPVSKDGTSLAEMADGCAKLGVPVESVFATPRELGHFPLPAIAHLQPPDASRSRLGHYVVILRIDRHTVDFIDPTLPAVSSQLRGTF